MNNHLNQIMANALDPFCPPPPAHKIHAVTINLSGDKRTVHILAPSTSAAISRSIELLLEDNDEIPADGLLIVARVIE